jgi:hypothetical protein
MSDQCTLSGRALRWIFEDKIRPLWGYLPSDMAARVSAVVQKQAKPDELVITRADFDRGAEIAWAELKKRVDASWI